VIPKFLLRGMVGLPLIVFGEGSQTRDFNYVEDTARAVFMAGLAETAVGQTINIGSGRETSVNFLAEKVIKLLERNDVIVLHDKPRPGDIARMFADGAKAKKILGYTPDVTLEDGLAKLKNWYCKEGKSAEALVCQEVVFNWDREELKKAKSI
jgi:UDP-glucose 4-epimerase